MKDKSRFQTGYYMLMVYAAMIGALSSLLAAAYITLYNWGVDFLKQPTLSVLDVNFWPLVMLTVAGVMIGLTIKFMGKHAGIGVAQRQYAQTGRLSARNLPSTMVQAFITLWSGASVGPEGPLTFLSGGVGSFIAERLKIEKEDLPVLVYSAIAGAFGGFFGSPVLGAVGAIEYMMIKELDIYRHLIPGLLAAAVGWGVYFALLQTSYLGIYSFPDYASPGLVDLWWALLVGVIGGAVGILFKLIFGITSLIFARLKRRPVLLAILGGAIIGLIGSFLPLTLYSGQDQLLEIIHNPAAFGIGLLLLMVLVKALLTSTSFVTGFDAGPIFPLLFMGGTLGLALSKILTFVPQGVAVTTGMAAVSCAVFPLPLTVILLLGLLGGQTDLLPVIAIGAVIGYLVSKVLTPLLPKPHASSDGDSEPRTA